MKGQFGGDESMSNFKDMSDWDLVNSFVTSAWNCRMKVPKEDRPEYNYYLNLVYKLRDELMVRLSNAKQ